MHVDVVFNKFVPCCKFQSGICRYTRGGGDDNCVWGFRVLEVEDPVKFNQAFRAIVPPGKPTHTHTCTHTCIYACTRQGNVFFTPKTDPVVHVLIPFLPSRSLSLWSVPHACLFHPCLWRVCPPNFCFAGLRCLPPIIPWVGGLCHDASRA